MNWSESSDWLSTGWLSHSEQRQRQRAQREWETREWQREWEAESWIWCVCVKWAEGGFNILFKRCVLHLFFFFLNFGLNRRFRPIQLDSAQIGPSRSRVGASQLKKNKSHVAWHGWTRGQRRPSRVAALDAGAAPLVPRSCFTATKLKFLPCCWLLPKKLGWPWIHWSGIPGMWFAHIWVGIKCLLGNIRQCLWTNGEDKDSRYLLWWGFYSWQSDTVSREMCHQFWLLKFGRWYVQVGFWLGYSLF